MNFASRRALRISWRALATLIVLVWVYILARHGKSLDGLVIGRLQPIQVGSEVGYADDAHMYFKGFSSPEGGYRWSAKPNAALIFKLADPKGQAFDVCAYGALVQGVAVSVKVNGHPSPSVLDQKWKQLCVTIMPSEVTGGLVRIGLHFSGMLHRSRDTRALGLHLTHVTLRENATDDVSP